MCGAALTEGDGGRRLACGSGHSFDVARQGYVNLLVGSRARAAGDSPEMVRARRRFLSTGAYDRISDAVAAAVDRQAPRVALDVGCGEGRYTARLRAPVVAGVDVSRTAVALAARAHPEGWYAVASAAALPVADGGVDVGVDVFGPVFAGELARVIRPGGAVVAAHPGPAHLAALRELVYDDPRPHEVKSPLRGAPEWFEELGSDGVRFEVHVADAAGLADLFAMTPYRWHGPPDMDLRMAAAAEGGFVTGADVRVTSYRRRATPPPSGTFAEP